MTHALKIMLKFSGLVLCLLITSTDGAAPSLWLTPAIGSVNGSETLSETLSEAHVVGTLLGSVTINNVPTDYVILSQTYDGMFNVTFNPSTSGDIYLINATHLDYEIDSTVTVVIQGSNTDGFGVANITINIADANDNPPTFTADSYQVTIPSSIANDSVIYTVLASDVDSLTNNDITYSIVAGDDTSNRFLITPRSGIVKRTGEAFNSSLYTLTINATDGTFTGSTTLTICIDCQNRAPVINMATSMGIAILMTSLLYLL